MTMNTQLNAPRELSLEEMEMVSGGKDIEVIDAAPPRNPPANENNFGAGGGSSGGTGTSSSGRGGNGGGSGGGTDQPTMTASDCIETSHGFKICSTLTVDEPTLVDAVETVTVGIGPVSFELSKEASRKFVTGFICGATLTYYCPGIPKK